MKSKFTIKTYLILCLLFFFILLIVKGIPNFFSNKYYVDKIFPVIFVPTLVILAFSILWGELRTKIINVKIRENDFEIKRFFGLKTETYKFSEISGWKYSHISTRGGIYEIFYLYQNKKKVIKISEFYHKNYFELKNVIKEKIQDLGYEPFSYIDELKEIFI